MDYLFLFAGMICFGWSNCLWRPLQENSPALELIFTRSLWTVPMIALAGLAVGTGLTTEKLLLAVRSLPYILLSLAGLYCFVRSMHYQPSGISGSLILYIGLFGSLVAWAFAGDRLPVYFGYTLVLYLSGLLLISPGMFRFDTPWRGTILALLAALCWAFANLGLKRGIEESGVWNLSLVQEITVLGLCGLILFVQKTKATRLDPENPIRPPYQLLIPLALLTVGGIVFCNASLGRIPVLHFALITMVQPVTTLILSAFIYKEKLDTRQWIGGALLIAGSVLCAIE